MSGGGSLIGASVALCSSVYIHRAQNGRPFVAVLFILLPFFRFSVSPLLCSAPVLLFFVADLAFEKCRHKTGARVGADYGSDVGIKDILERHYRHNMFSKLMSKLGRV